MKLYETIEYCKICFSKINDTSFYHLFSNKIILCQNCQNSLKAKFIKFKIGNIDALSLYEYDETIKKLIYTYKGCYDIELKNVFLHRYLLYLQTLYRNYYVIPIPSNKIEDQKRGFNHVKEICSTLKLPVLDVLEKHTREKQSSKTSKDRLKIEKYLTIKNKEILYGKKVLLVDDIYTTGATMFKAIELVKTAKPKKIKVLVIAKTIDLDKRGSNY